MKKNCILLLLDSITYDAISCEKISEKLFPNLYFLAKKFKMRKCISNSNCTQFVLPSLFSMTLPLDEGGYDYGIKNRKLSFMEILKNEGFQTIIYSNCNQMGADNGYDRGVDENINSFDYRLILEQKLNRVILSSYKKNFQNENSDLELIENYKYLLLDIKEKITTSNKLIWTNKLIKLNNYIKNKIDSEIRLIAEKPTIVKKKLLKINPASIWMFLGDRNISSLTFYFKRIKGSFNWRIKNLITKSKIPINLLGHETINIIESFNVFKNKILSLKKPFFIYHHIMDLHDYENLNSITFFLKKLFYLPKWIWFSRQQKSKRKFFYDATLILVDIYIGKILKILDSNTIIYITSDHGHRKSLKKQIQRKYITKDYFNEMHGEDIEIPLISNKDLNSNNSIKLFDTISISKKIISDLDIQLSNYIKEIDIDNEYIISEHAGRGSFDLNKNLYFTISNDKFRMIVVFFDDQLYIKLYDLIEDIDEIKDLSNEEQYSNIVKYIFNFLAIKRFKIVNKKIKLLKKVHNKFLKINDYL